MATFGLLKLNYMNVNPSPTTITKTDPLKKNKKAYISSTTILHITQVTMLLSASFPWKFNLIKFNLGSEIPYLADCLREMEEGLSWYRMGGTVPSCTPDYTLPPYGKENPGGKQI